MSYKKYSRSKHTLLVNKDERWMIFEVNHNVIISGKYLPVPVLLNFESGARNEHLPDKIYRRKKKKRLFRIHALITT